MAEFFEVNIIDDVAVGTKRYIKEQWGVKFYLPAAISVFFGVLEFIYWGEPRLFFWGAIIWIISGYAWAYSIATKEFMRQFAKANGMAYVGDVDAETMHGNLFKKGNENSRSVTHLVDGEKSGQRIRFFFYSYTVGSGKHKTTYAYTACEIFFKGQAPDIVVESKSDWDFVSYAREHQKEMPVESFFKKHFGVYVPEDFEIETLEIFTPDVMEYLVDRAKIYNFEFIGDRLYIFRQSMISKRAELQEFFEISNYLVAKLAPKIFRLHGAVVAMKEARG